MPVQPLEHINCFNRDSLVERLRDLGFREVDVIDKTAIKKMAKNMERKAGRLMRAVLNKRRPPLTINIVAQRISRDLSE